MTTSTSNSPLRYVAPALAAVVLAFAGYSIGKSNDSSSAATPSLASAQSGQLPQGSAQTPQAPQGSTQAPQGSAQLPQGGQAPPGFGTPATGADATKAKAAATAKYPGNVEQVMKLSDGSYVVHVITSSGELHVKVSKAFAVTGIDQGGPPQGAAPQGTAPQSGSTTQTQ